ncbi:unnamed protein product [Adineta ricciae]|uniref:ubiquitinyl hydrolase 1 n=1 Tax=Adineta ricciae TaxID=249248 RepID=A0A815Q258_ADIRI|nr:unnamed protein product [Adineta ricciae]
MARTSFFNPIHASKKECRIQLKPSDDESECGSMFRQLPLCIGARVICRRNIDFDEQMRYVDWCLSRSFHKAETSSIVSVKTSATTLIKIDSKCPKYETSTFSTTTSFKKPEDIIICEKQESLYCGRHVLRAVSQRLDLFSDTYLKEVAQNLANFEQIYSHQESVLVTEYHHENTGEYNIDDSKLLF